MHVNYIFIFTEKMKFNVEVNKTYKYNVELYSWNSFYGHLNKLKGCNGAKFIKNAWCLEVHHYILLGGGKVTKYFA